MTFLLKQLFGLVKLLNSDTGGTSIAAGITCGFILGMTPSLSLQSLLIFFVLFFFRIQVGAAFIAAFFFKFCAYLLDPVFDIFGRKILEMPALEKTFITLYNMPLVPYTRFNNSIVMGSGVVALILSPIVFFVSLKLIHKYRETVVARWKETKAFKALKATSLYQWYYKYDSYKF